MAIRITVDGDDHDLNVAISALIHSKLSGLNIHPKIDEDIKQEVLDTTVFMAVTKIENHLKLSEIDIVIHEGNISKTLQEFGPLA
jgi:hypothetical protein